jgi:hypothetical protein
MSDDELVLVIHHLYPKLLLDSFVQSAKRMKYEYIIYLIVLFTNDRILIFLFDSKSPSINEAA